MYQILLENEKVKTSIEEKERKEKDTSKKAIPGRKIKWTDDEE